MLLDDPRNRRYGFFDERHLQFGVAIYYFFGRFKTGDSFWLDVPVRNLL